MVYVFYGNEPYLIKKEIQKVMKQHQLEEIDMSRYDLTQTSLEDIIDDASTLSFFHSQKMILVENAYLFTGNSKKIGLEQNIEILDQYLEHFNPDCHLIFTVPSEKLDERKKIVKKLHQVGVLKSLGGTSNLRPMIMEMLEEYQMDAPAISLLLDRTKGDLVLLEQEIAKLKMYRLDEKHITYEDVNLYVAKMMELDLFQLIENIVSRKKEAALFTYSDMLKNNEEPLKIIIMLANQFRLIYQTKELYKKGYTEKDIASKLAIHPYRIKLALQSSRNFDHVKLLDYIKALAIMDSKIKHGQVDKKLALELFILEV